MQVEVYRNGELVGWMDDVHPDIMAKGFSYVFRLQSSRPYWTAHTAAQLNDLRVDYVSLRIVRYERESYARYLLDASDVGTELLRRISVFVECK